MARKISKPAGVGAAAEHNAGKSSDLDTLHPERLLLLAGGKLRVVVREYGHLEWLRLLQQAEPLVAAIAVAIGAGREPSYEEALAILAQHADALAPLVAQAADMELAVFDALQPDDGELLLMTWWGCNGRFFVRRALNRVAITRAEAIRPALAAASAGARSTPP